MILDPSQIMSRAEVAAVLADLHRRGKTSRHARQKLVVFRLTIGAGLRISEITGLDLGDLKLTGSRPHIALRAAVAKGGNAHGVPLWWDTGTLALLEDWRKERVDDMGATASDPVVCTLTNRPLAGFTGGGKSQPGRRMSRQQAYSKWMAAIAVLDEARRGELHPHSGRHTFGSYMAHERTLAEVRDAMGHKNITTTNIYLHVRPEDIDRRGDVFGGEASESA